MTEIERHNDMIARANAEIDALEAANIPCRARLMAQGVEIEIHRPTWGGVSRNFLIVTPRP